MARKRPATEPDPGAVRLPLDETHAANLKALASLAARASSRGEKSKPIAAPTSVEDPYTNRGSHPDIVQRVWDELGRALPEDGRCLLFGTPALVHPKSGVILAVCFGTAYSLRLPSGAARPPRRRLVQEWSTGGETNVESEFGPGWMFGDFSPGEVEGMEDVYQEFS
jgi:hypothetical protein